MIKKIDWIITGTKRSHAGPEPLLWNESTFSNDDKSLYGMAYNDFVISLSQTEKRCIYRLYTSKVAYSDAMRPGAWLAVGVAIPREYRLSDEKSPYDLLINIYETFLELCMERGVDGCYRFKNEDDYNAHKERFSTIVDAFSLEPYEGVYYPMAGEKVNCIVTGSEERMRRLLMDSQYREFSAVKQVHIMERMGNFSDELLLQLEIPRPKEYTLYVDGNLQAKTYRDNEQITLSLNPRKHYTTVGCPSFIISDCENGGSVFVQVNKRKEEVRVDTSSFYTPIQYLCKLNVILDGLDNQEELSKIALFHGGNRLKLTNNFFYLVGDAIEILPRAVYSGENEFVAPKEWKMCTHQGGWHAELTCTIRKKAPTIAVVNVMSESSTTPYNQPALSKVKENARSIEVISAEEINTPIGIHIYKSSSNQLVYKNTILLKQQKRNFKGVFYLNNDFDEYDTHVLITAEELGYCKAVLSQTIQLGNWQREKKQIPLRTIFLLAVLLAFGGVVGGAVGIRIHESSNGNEEIKNLRDIIKQKEDKIIQLEDSIKQKEDKIIQLEDSIMKHTKSGGSKLGNNGNNVAGNEWEKIIQSLAIVSVEGTGSKKKTKSMGDPNGYLTLKYYISLKEQLLNNKNNWGDLSGYAEAVKKTEALIKLFECLSFDKKAKNQTKTINDGVEKFLNILKEDSFKSDVSFSEQQEELIKNISKKDKTTLSEKLSKMLSDENKSLGWSYIYYLSIE